MNRNWNLKKLMFIGFLTFIAFSIPVLAEQKTLPANQIKSIIIKVDQLNLKIKRQKSSNYVFKWNKNLSFNNKNGSLHIVSSDFSSKKSWEKENSKSSLTLEISGSSVPIKLFASSSTVSISQWIDTVFISSFKGEIKASNNTGEWNIVLKDGLINLNNHKGSLKVKGFHIKNTLVSSQGDFQFQINEGLLEMKKCEGKVKFTTNKANIKLTQFTGDIKGFNHAGTLNISVKPRKLNLYSNEGPIYINFMGQKPKITAYTENGKIYATNRNLHKKFSGKSTEVSGGYSKQGNVSLKTETGTIYIR